MTFRTSFSDPFITDVFGNITGVAGQTKFPNLPGSLFRLKAHSSNIGSFFIGHVSGSALPFEICAGEDLGWFTVSNSNLNSLYYNNPSGSSDYLQYWLQK